MEIPQTERPRPTKNQIHDESVMNTNSSCIVSKRSVEKVYHRDDHGFLRHFVKKFQRRAPLINRGYWLRMQAIEHVGRKFLEMPSQNDKVIVNLGCGYDPLPLKFLSRNPILCQHVTFVDVDYAQIIKNKCEIISKTPQLLAALGDNFEIFNEPNKPMLQSQRYAALACDLQKTDELSIIDTVIGSSHKTVLFIAEVSLTYMKAQQANNVIGWASKYRNGTFCMLEQYLPDGSGHPFARTMLNHFEKLRSPLKSAVLYPSLHDQKIRFTSNAWSCVEVQNLWNLWSNDSFLQKSDRQKLDEIEPFDEWEEYSMYASHYFLLLAGQDQKMLDSYLSFSASPSPHPVDPSPIEKLIMKPQTTINRVTKRRQASSFATNASSMYHIAGHSTQGRLSSIDHIYSASQTETSVFDLVDIPDNDLMCHTTTEFCQGQCLLVGGRKSPHDAKQSCFYLHSGRWQRADDLPRGLYRHCATKIEVDGSQGVLVYGGKHNSTDISSEWLLWTPQAQWRRLICERDRPVKLFGASIVSLANEKGLLLGGIDGNGTINKKFWSWHIRSRDNDEKLYVECRESCSDLTFEYSNASALARFGARVVPFRRGALLVGGVGAELFKQEEEMVYVDATAMTVSGVAYAYTVRPLLVGISLESVGSEHFFILGGGAVCFSFGTYWNDGLFSCGHERKYDGCWTSRTEPNQTERYISKGLADMQKQNQLEESENGESSQSSVVEIPRHTIKSEVEFQAILRGARPLILEKLDIGRCVDLWDLSYLRERVGATREVVIHSSPNKNMDFVNKTFEYKREDFGTFIDSIEKGEEKYLRSISCDNPQNEPTKITKDFPELAEDFKLPTALTFVNTHMHSSPLRISGPVNMWLHYDVMANVLCQIRGTKQLILFDPADVNKLGFAAGASSSTLNVFGQHGDLPTRYEANLGPGDVLFIPSLWAHSAAPKSCISVAVNVFFRDMSSGYAAGKDVYGNRDLQGYENGRRDVQKIARAFREVPSTTRKFYMRRLAQELLELAD